MVDDNARHPYAAARGMTRIPTAFEGSQGVRPVDTKGSSASSWSDYSAFASRVRARVDDALDPWLERRVEDARHCGPEVEAVAMAVASLVLRGGKRMRPVLLAAAFEACGGDGAGATVTPAGVALELLQAYLLVHDDWMDGDATRRGGPSVPAMMRERFGSRADAMSVLAGDLAAAWARRALLDMALPPERVMRAASELARVEEEVVQGQILDVCGAARDVTEVEAVHALKTASYSVRGPVIMGAHLAGAHLDRVAALASFAAPLGVAFQLRDDVLGVFGNPVETGKPAGGDIRSGKRSAVLIEAVREPQCSGALARVLGRADASAEDVRRATESLLASGVRERIEARIEALAGAAHAALERSDLEPRGRALLAEAILVFTRRNG